MKSAREAIFWHFFRFFLGQKIFFSPTFFKIFSGILKFSRAEFQNFSRVEYYFSRAEILEFFAFSRGKFCIFFSGTLFFFLGQNFAIFSREHFFLLGQFSKFFLGKFQIFSGRKLKIFSGRKIFFSGKKKNTVWPMAAQFLLGSSELSW